MPYSNPKGYGFVPPEFRGGFKDLWQASNALELTSHPYEGTLWDGDGKPMHFEGVFRAEYITSLAVRFLRQKHRKPFLLVVSQLEPHEQNDVQAFLPPKGYREHYQNPIAPEDLRFFPGDWQAQLPGYYGNIKSIDESVGTLLKTLAEENLEDETIVMFISDHGCHFRTRNRRHKLSPHGSSIHIPLVLQGPGLNQSRMVRDLVSMVDVMPTLLDILRIDKPHSVRGQSFLALINNHSDAREKWRDDIFIQISETMVARALRTDEWTYCVVAPNGNGRSDPGSTRYREYQMYSFAADPHQLLNLAGRDDPINFVHYIGDRQLPEVAAYLRDLFARISSHPQSRLAELLPDQWKLVEQDGAGNKVEG